MQGGLLPRSQFKRTGRGAELNRAPAPRGRRMAAAAPRAVAAPERPLQGTLERGGAGQAELVFVSDKGERIRVMPADYGFRSGAGRLYQDGYGGVPSSAWALATDNFRKELRALRRSVRFDEYHQIAEAAEGGPLRRAGFAVGGAVRRALSRVDQWLEGQDVLGELPLPRVAGAGDALTPAQADVLQRVGRLTLDDKLVAEREARREAAEGRVQAPLLIRLAYHSLCWVLDVVYAGRPIQRFWFLETVARMPYFAFISMLHLYESLGWWRAGAELRRVHFAEEWNELHHLQIMEALGGDQLWVDRFMAEHAAVFYYWVLVGMYLVSPAASYAFSELIEAGDRPWAQGHAVDTYAEFVEQNEAALKDIPPPLVALNYYKAGDLYLFDQLQTGWPARSPRRPPCGTLYDVFANVRDDEAEHVKTMTACKDGSIAVDLPQPPQAAASGGAAEAGGVAAPAVRTVGTFDEEDGPVDGLEGLGL